MTLGDQSFQQQNALTVGNASNLYSYPGTQFWPNYYPAAVVASDEYANEVSVKAGKYDAEVTFSLRSGTCTRQVTKIRVPLALLDELLPKRGAKR